MDYRHYALALSFVEGIGSVRYRRLIEHFGSAECVFSAMQRELLDISGMDATRVSAIRSFNGWTGVEKEIERTQEEGAALLFLEDEGYPLCLKEIFDPPPALYLNGAFTQADMRCIAVVGSRNSTRYGIVAAESIALGLASRGFTVVSGMARGIDSAAHIGAIKGEGRTIAVLGTGINIIYPPENRALFRDIARNGTVITEFALDTEPMPGNFPRRNRIISGISLGVVVVEAAPKSGALITARCALDQNREVFAVPGNITSMRSRGTHDLIRQGAKLVERAEDIIEELCGVMGEGDKSSRAAADQRQRLIDALTHEEKSVMDCVENGPIPLDLIIEQCGFETQKVLAILLELEMKGLVKRAGASEYVNNTF